MGGFLDLESPPTSKMKSNKGNQQWTFYQFHSAQAKTHQYRRGTEKAKMREVTLGMCGTGLKMITETFGS